MIKVCVVGMGAVGGALAAGLGRCEGVVLSALARGETLAALQSQGLVVQQLAGGVARVDLQAGDRPEDLGPQDVVILAVKAPALPALAPTLAPLLGPDTLLLPAMNGVPWWFSAGLSELGEHPLPSVDPGGMLVRSLSPDRVIGAVVHFSSQVPRPGWAQEGAGRRLIIGEPAGGMSARVGRMAVLLRSAGFLVDESPAIRRDLWYKLWGNLSINPISALTGATVDRILADSSLRDWCTQIMLEASRVGARLGCEIDQSPQDRHRITASLGAFRTSMLQDVQAGRAIELDAIVTSVRDIARRVGEPVPAIDALLGLTRVFAQVRGLYPASLVTAR